MNQTLNGEFAAFDASMSESGLCTSLCTIRTETKVQDSFGALVSQSPPVYTNLHVDVPCQMGTPVSSQAGYSGDERRGPELTKVSLEREVIIPQYFADFNDKIQNISSYQVVVDGVEYNILGVVNDSQKVFTELHLELMTSGTWGTPS